MREKIIERVVRRARVPDLFEALTRRLSGSDLQSLLLEVYRERASAVTPGQLLRHYERNRFVQPSPLDPRRILDFDRLAYSLLPPSFDVLELSPVCPLGTNSAVAPLDPNQAVATIRNTEVCSDSTNAMALECARRRGASPAADTRLCASHRLLRPHLPDRPATFPHFRIFSLCTAGRDRGSYRFEAEALAEHLDFYLRLLGAARESGFRVGAVRTSLSVFDEPLCAALQARVLDGLSRAHPEVAFELDRSGPSSSYYSGVRFQIHARDASADEYFLVDGGFTDWTRQLLSNRKERLLISGMGSERFVACFAVPD